MEDCLYPNFSQNMSNKKKQYGQSIYLVPLRKRQSLRYFEILNPHLQSVNSGLKFQKASDISCTRAGPDIIESRPRYNRGQAPI